GFMNAGLVQRQFLVGRRVGDAAIFAQLVDRFAAVETRHFVSDGLDSAVLLDQVGEAGVERAGPRVVEEFRRHGLPLLGLIAIGDQLARRPALHRPLGRPARCTDEEGDQEKERNRPTTLSEHIYMSPWRSRHGSVAYYTRD